MGAFVEESVVFGPNVNGSRLRLLSATIGGHIFVFGRRSVRVYLAGCVLFISGLLFVIDRAFVATFSDLIGLAMSTRRSRPLK